MGAAHNVTDEVEASRDLPGRPEDWCHINSHDLRRYFAQTALRRREMDPGVGMAVGG